MSGHHCIMHKSGNTYFWKLRKKPQICSITWNSQSLCNTPKLAYVIPTYTPVCVQRCRMNEDSGVHYMSAWQLGEPVDGLGGVGEVVSSRDPGFDQGNLVCSTFLWPWAAVFATDSKNLRKVSVCVSECVCVYVCECVCVCVCVCVYM